MPQNFFIIGDPKAGKTTLLKDIIAELKGRGLRVGGFISPSERHHGTRTAFHVMDVETGKQAMLASVDGDGPKVSKYHVDVKSFESIAVPAMGRVEDYDVFVIDEIGRMEMKSAKFTRLLDTVLESHTPLMAALHKDFTPKFGPFGELVELTPDNRNGVYLRLLKRTNESYTKKAARQAKPGKAAKKKGKAAAPKKARTKRKRKPKAEKAAERKEKAAEKPRVEKREEPRKAKPEKKGKGVFGWLRDLFG